MPTDKDVKPSVEEVIKQLRALVIIDGVGSDISSIRGRPYTPRAHSR